MKKMILLACLILFSAPTVWGQDKCEAPTLNIGDKWRYSDAKGQWNQEVIDIKNDIYVIRYYKENRGYDKNNMNLNFLIDEDGRKTMYTSTRSKVLNFPLSIGKKWSNIVAVPQKRNPRYVDNLMEEYFVSSYEDTKVKAGTFKAFRIEYRLKNMSTSNEVARGAYWYSPDVKTIIKRSEEVSVDVRPYELISYELKQ